MRALICIRMVEDTILITDNEGVAYLASAYAGYSGFFRPASGPVLRIFPWT